MFWDGSRWIDERSSVRPPLAPRECHPWQSWVATLVVTLLVSTLVGPALLAGPILAPLSVSRTVLPEAGVATGGGAPHAPVLSAPEGRANHAGGAPATTATVPIERGARVAPMATARSATRGSTRKPRSTLSLSPVSPVRLGFVRRNGTDLTVDGVPYRFVGLNMYDSVAAPCWKYPIKLSTALRATTGQTVARVFAFQRMAVTNGRRDWTYIDNALASYRAARVRVILTLTDTVSGQPCTDSATDRTLAWYRSGYKHIVEGATTYRDWVAQIVRRYRDDPTVMAWQLVNEGEARSQDGTCSEARAAAALRTFADDVGSLVKRLDPNHLVSLGTISGQCGSNEADYLVVYGSPFIDLCDYHDYNFPNSPMGNTDHTNGLPLTLGRATALHKPLMVGEMGIRWDALSTATRAYRAKLLDAKLSAQLSAGVAGVLLWSWSDTLSDQPYRSYEIAPRDPALALLAKYSVRQ